MEAERGTGSLAPRRDHRRSGLAVRMPIPELQEPAEGTVLLRHFHSPESEQ